MWSRRTQKKWLALSKGRGETPVDATERPGPREGITRDDPDRSTENRLPTTSIPPSTEHLADDPDAMTLWLRRTDQLLLGFLLIALLGLLIAFRWKLSGGGQTEIEISSQQPREYYYTIDLNNASWVEWAQLDGIGEKLAKRVVQDRNDRGPFASVDELSRVRGFGPKLIEKLRPFLKCTIDDTAPMNDALDELE